MYVRPLPNGCHEWVSCQMVSVKQTLQKLWSGSFPIVLMVYSHKTFRVCDCDEAKMNSKWSHYANYNLTGNCSGQWNWFVCVCPCLFLFNTHWCVVVWPISPTTWNTEREGLVWTDPYRWYHYTKGCMVVIGDHLVSQLNCRYSILFPQ